MEAGNVMQLSQFLLLGFAEDPELQPLIYGLFLSMYPATVLGNLLILLAIISDPYLHMPMYFFLSKLSFGDIGFTSTTVPKMLVNSHTYSEVITYAGCITQMYFLLLFSGLDIFLLTVMAYDCYMAICYPLCYTVIIHHWICGLSVLACWIVSVLSSFLHTLIALCLSFCGHSEIPHFFCELNQVVHHACSDTFLNDIVIYVTALLVAFGPLGGILYSYSKILSSVRAVSSAQGKHKAFSTCTSHLSVVSLFYCMLLGVYLSSAVTKNPGFTAVASLMYTVVTPMLNPFIYSLKNKDIKSALRRLLGRVMHREAVESPW